MIAMTVHDADTGCDSERGDLRADDFQIFLEVARRGRLIEAARVLKINHITVGRHVSQLERSVPEEGRSS